MMDFTPLEDCDGVTRLIEQDTALFRAAFHSDVLCYASSWLYILRAARTEAGEPGYKYARGGILLGLGYRNRTLYLTRAYGQPSAHAVAGLCADLFAKSGCQIILKKVEPDLARQLLDLPHFHSPHAEIHPGILEDEAFPEHQVSLDSLFSTDDHLTATAKNLRKKTKQFHRAGSGIEAVFNPSLKAEEIIKNMAALTHGNPEKHATYAPIIRETFRLGVEDDSYLTCLFSRSTGFTRSVHW